MGLAEAKSKEDRRAREEELKRAKDARRAEEEGKLLGKKLDKLNLE